MITQKIMIQSPDGLHARPAGELVRAVKSFAGTTVTLATAARKVNAASMLSILSLGNGSCHDDGTSVIKASFIEVEFHNDAVHVIGE